MHRTNAHVQMEEVKWKFSILFARSRFIFSRTCSKRHAAQSHT